MTTDNINTPPEHKLDNSQDKLDTDHQSRLQQKNEANNTGQIGHLELLEERPVVNKERLDVGKVTVTKHTRTKTIDVPIELVEEYITVRTEFHDTESQDLLSGNYDEKDVLRHVEPALDSKAVITVNDKQVEIGEAPIEIVVSRQVATVTKYRFSMKSLMLKKKDF